MSSRLRTVVVGAFVAMSAASCGDDATTSGRSLADVLPEVPAPTGAPPTTYAGPVTQASDLLDGEAAYGMVGDYVIRNARARFIVQSEARVIGVVPQGGNLIDAALIDASSKPQTEDHFGELSLIYVAGRTCEHESIDIVQDGSEGGAAVLRARGRSNVNDFINLRGVGIVPIDPEIDPDIGDDIECATTYVLFPDEAMLHVYWTFFNAGDTFIRGPVATLTDIGGETEVFAPTRGFERISLDAIASGSLNESAPVDYIVYQGPSVAYGIIPVRDSDISNSQITISGVSILLFGADQAFDLFNRDSWIFEAPPQQGTTYRAAVVVGRDAADVERRYLALQESRTAQVRGVVQWDSGAVADGARVGIYLDADEDGAIGPNDPIRTYTDPDDTGAFVADVQPGMYLVRAEVKNTARTDAVSVQAEAGDTTDVSLRLPTPVVFDYAITDASSGNCIPGRLTVIGPHPVFPDVGVFETADRQPGVVMQISTAVGTSVDIGDGASEKLVLAPGQYRIYATRGTEWSADSVDLEVKSGDGSRELSFELAHVVPTPGYVATEFHQHSIGSPDSPLGRAQRLVALVAEGIEFFAATDHDYVSDFAPLIQSLGLSRRVHSISGSEMSSFAYGHFQAYPLELDPDDPSGGAIDWPRGMDGFAMTPREIWANARRRGAEVIQINHPRTPSSFKLSQYFDRVGLRFDYEQRSVFGDLAAVPVPNDWLRLPDISVWDASFDVLETWNGQDNVIMDTDDDGVRDNANLDLVMRDWFNFLSFGVPVTPLANSDSHALVVDRVGMPRSYVRVRGDLSMDLESGAVRDDVMDTLTGRTPRDVIMTNGPYLEIGALGDAPIAGSALGQVVDASQGRKVTLSVKVLAPAWAQVDTIEVFINATPDTLENRVMGLSPMLCLTARGADARTATDTCANALLGLKDADIRLRNMPNSNGAKRWEGDVEIELTAADVASLNREGARGTDAWVVVRVRGTRAVFPVNEAGAISPENIDTLTRGKPSEVDNALTDVGVPAMAVTSAVFIDFDGGGYAAPFAP